MAGEIVAAGASARARAAGMDDPLGLDPGEVDRAAVGYGLWYAKTVARSGNADAAAALFAAPELRACALADPALLSAVGDAHRAVGGLRRRGRVALSRLLRRN
jgi:hypothetical protein